MVNDVNDERCENGERRSSFKNGIHRLPFIVHIVHGTHHCTCTQYSKVPYGRGTVEVRSQCGRGAVKVLSRYAPDSLVVLHAQGSFTPAILA